MVVLSAPDTGAIKNNFASFINDASLFTDPYVQQTGTSRPTGSPLATTSPFSRGGTFPRVHVDIEEVGMNFITGQQRGSRIEQRQYNINIFYYNKQRHGFTQGGSPFADENQTIKFLEIIRDTIKNNLEDARFEKLRGWSFGPIAKPTFATDSGVFLSFLPIIVSVYTK